MGSYSSLAFLGGNKKIVVCRLKLSHELQLANIPDFQVRPPWCSVPFEVRLTELTSNKASYPVAMLKSQADDRQSQARDDFPEVAMVYTDRSLNPDGLG